MRSPPKTCGDDKKGERELKIKDKISAQIDGGQVKNTYQKLDMILL